MRIFSNTHLHWGEVQLLKCVARRYPGYAMGMYLYRIQDLRRGIPHFSASVDTHAPLDVLQENRPYYCYHMGKHFTTNARYWVSLRQEECNYEIYLPSSVTCKDVIAVQDRNRARPQEVFLGGLLL